ncbi:Methyltransferase type 11 [Cellulomonas flavigena DSM 20109]|uniref:Methyltransferase type 11 n=1 Tax=Cellulomonas flavigena (strain ATCC 482 / DSM 20109 / BCRC 11376 / JCM 18109 / NBRC 3775 / NCIMB 8073 / NRS 134) TaxID=446466 RepID=D5UHZ7_CELFN|nr:class I SAM-dependent methyltransferase [Cellulomonas flavigena]ADG73421.1 Methyltransferase type 11 [Cellulomonas flavigena DSM 20109]
MRVGQLAWRACYEWLGARVRQPAWTFMNYGFAPVDAAPPLPLDPADEPDRYGIQLYAHALDGLDLTGADVLEVGCGRGGGASWVARTRGPATTTGVDLAASAVRLCRRTREGPGLRFVQGDALALPFDDATFDVVLNVESSHCYPSTAAFAAEVHRVLRPGGTFAWADFRPADDVATVREQLRSSGLEPVRELDVTDEVVHALRLDDARRAELVESWIPRAARPLFRPFAALDGTPTHERFVTGETRYLSAQLRRAVA